MYNLDYFNLQLILYIVNFSEILLAFTLECTNVSSRQLIKIIKYWINASLLETKDST